VYLAAVETSTAQASVAVADADGVVAEARLVRPRRHAEFCLPALELCLREGGIDISQLTGVGVGLGPGLFTGLRVGIATARGLARGCQIPVCGLPSLDILAFATRHTTRTIVPVIDARRHEVYYAFYRPLPGGVQRISEYGLARPEALAAELSAAGSPVVLVGDGAHAYRDLFKGHMSHGDGLHRYPSASALIELAAPRFEREEFCRPEDLSPIYLRPPDAKIAWDK
jgi:tRNA threonylcarbamoyladenosine biosynthesis protein TsaB